MVAYNILLLTLFYAQFYVHCLVLEPSESLNDVKILQKKGIIDVTQHKARSNIIHIAHNIPIDGTIKILQTQPIGSRISIALNAARGCKVKVEINEPNGCSLEIHLNSAQNSKVDVIVNRARNSAVSLTFTNSLTASVTLSMDSPRSSSINIEQDRPFKSPIVARIKNPIDSKVSIEQAKGKASPMDICIEEGNNGNAVNVVQRQPIQSELTRTSFCQLSENAGSISTIKPTTLSSSVPNIELTTALSSQTTTQPTSIQTKPTADPTINDGSAIIFETTTKHTLNSLDGDGEEEEDYYYYYDFNNDENFDVSDFPDYEDYQIGTRNSKRGKCIKVPKNEATKHEWVRKIAPLWRSLAQEIGVRRCKSAKAVAEKNDAVRFGF